jgi:hypothetical protein
MPPLDQDKWELYHVAEDFSEADDLAASNPDKLKELRALFDKEAIRNHVYPIDDRRAERFDPEIAGRPDLLGGRTSMTLFEGMTGIAENAFINLKNRSYSITADVEVPAGAHGVIACQAGRFGGWTLYMKAGKARHTYNYGGLEWTTVEAPQPLAAGKHTLRYEFAFDGGPPGSGGTGRLIVDGKAAGEKKIARMMPYALSADEGVDIGLDQETPVSEDYKAGDNTFSGRILQVKVEAQPPAAK